MPQFDKIDVGFIHGGQKSKPLPNY